MNSNVRVIAVIILLAAVAARPVAAQVGSTPAILEPRTGEVLQGTVLITGSSTVAQFVSSEIDFSYSNDPTGTWFLIALGSQPVDNGPLASWDTTTITDGDYQLRMRILLSDGSVRETIVRDLRVRNYTPIETPTLAPAAQSATQTLTATATLTPFPTPTALPRNPVALTPVDVFGSVLVGGIGAVLFLLLLGLYLRSRRK